MPSSPTLGLWDITIPFSYLSSYSYFILPNSNPLSSNISSALDNVSPIICGTSIPLGPLLRTIFITSPSSIKEPSTGRWDAILPFFTS